MPFGKWKDWAACIADIGKKNPDYSEEQVKRVCGKLKAKLEKCSNPDAAYSAVARHLEKADAESVAPMTADIDKKHAQMQIKKSWMHELHGILNSPRVAEMTFHVPKVDKDMEFITPGAMAGALQDYMKFPIISEFHKERPIGIAEKVWQTNTDEFKARIRIRDDPSTDDVWNKMNLPEGTPGRYDQVSIAGKRIVYSQECDIPLSMRKATQPCRTEKLRLDSVSVCDDRARNDGTELNVVKALSDDLESFVYTTSLVLTKVEDNLIKAETTESELIHPVTDGASQPDKTFVEDNIVCPLTRPATGANHPKGGKMKKGTEKKIEKTSDEEAQEPVEETEAKKGEKYEADPEKQVEKGEEGEEAMETKEILSGIHKMMKEIHALISSDKKVHKEVEKGEPPEESRADKEEEKEKRGMAKEEESRAKREEKKDENVHKAAMEQDFQKALDAAVAPLQLQITALAVEVKKLGDEPLYKSGLLLETLQVNAEGKPEMGNAAAHAAMRKKQQGGK
jgi:hypothetical protein